MKKILAMITITILSMPLLSYAADDIHNMSIKNAMKMMPDSVKAKLGDFKFNFASDSVPVTGDATNKVKTSDRTNSVFKDSVESCNWVFYSALINIKKDAQKIGGTSVDNIQSNWRNNPTSSNKTFVCADGLIMSGVALTGYAVK